MAISLEIIIGVLYTASNVWSVELSGKFLSCHEVYVT